MLNFIEILQIEEDDYEKPEEKKIVKKFVNSIIVYREDGSILKSLYEETLNVKRDLVCDIDGDNLIIYYKDDGSVVKKDSVSAILISRN